MPVDPVVAPHTAPATSRHYLPLLQHTNFALHRDFCPWANRWVYWLKRPLWGIVSCAWLRFAGRHGYRRRSLLSPRSRLVHRGIFMALCAADSRKVSVDRSGSGNGISVCTLSGNSQSHGRRLCGCVAKDRDAVGLAGCCGNAPV